MVNIVYFLLHTPLLSGVPYGEVAYPHVLQGDADQARRTNCEMSFRCGC